MPCLNNYGVLPWEQSVHQLWLTYSWVFFEKDLLERAPGRQHIYKNFWKRYIDDILLIWTGTEEELKKFLAFIDTLHPTIKFTSDYDFQTKSVSYLDTRITIKNGKLTTDLYQKDTHSAQYLLPS